MTGLVLARIAGFVWLALAFSLLLPMLLLTALAIPSFLIFAALGIPALIAAALLLVRPAARGLFAASATMGVLFTAGGIATYLGQSDGQVIGTALVVGFVALSSLAVVVSAAGAQVTLRDTD